MKQTENIISEQIITGGGHHQIDLISIIIRINREETWKTMRDMGDQGGKHKIREENMIDREETWKTIRNQNRPGRKT